jgi:SAM-dependent methyltransferase
MASNPTAAPILFDRALLRARQDRAGRGGTATFLLDRVAEDMEERLAAVTRNFSDAAEIWTPGELLRKPLADGFQSIRRIDLDPSETLPLQPESLDLAVSALAFQFVNDLPGVLAQIRRALKPDGLLLAAMIGGDTLTELRQSFAAAEAECEGGASPRVAPFADLRDVGALLQRAGLALRGALRQRVFADDRSPADGRDQYFDRAAAHADPPRHHDADGADLCRSFCRRGRPHPRDL